MSFLIACLIFYAVSALGVYFLLKGAVGITADEKSLFRFVTFCPIINTTLLTGYLVFRAFYLLK